MVITWQSAEEENEGIFARQFHMTPGVDISDSALTTQLITVDKSTDNATPSVDINTEGKFVVALETKYRYLTCFSIFNNDGSSSSWYAILTNTVVFGNTVTSRYQDVVIQESGNIVIADWSAGFLGIGKGVYLTSYENDGSKIDTTDLISGSDHIKPSIAKDLNGNTIVVYEGSGDGDGSAVIGQRFDSNLNDLGGAFRINETIIGAQHMASVAMLDLNHFVVAWSGNGTGDSDGVFVRQFNTLNNPPTLTTFSSEIKNTDKNTEVEITFSELETKGNETDLDGIVDAFVVKNVISGSLAIGNSAGTASAWAAGTNDTIDNSNHAYWTPVLNTSGLQNVFALVAKDNQGKESLDPVTAQIIVNTVTSPLITKSDFLVNQTTAGLQETSMEDRGSPQAVAIASNGDYVVVWTEVEGSGDYSDIFARQYNADGTAKGSAFQVNNYVAGEQQWATVASDASGRFVIAWTSDGQDGNGHGVYLRRFNADGTAIDTTDILVNTGNTDGNQSNPALTMNSLGKMVITWQSDTGINKGILAQMLDMNDIVAGSQLSNSPIIVDTGNNRYASAVDINTEGKFVITWGKGNNAFYRTYDSDGVARINVTKANVNGDVQYQAVAIQDSGKFIIADLSFGSLSRGVWVAIYSDDGNQIDDHKVTIGNSHTTPSIAKDSDGNFIIVYQGNGDGDGNGIFAQKYDSNLNKVNSEILINDSTTGNQHLASIAMLDLDNYIVVWSGKGVGDSNGVFTRQFGTSPPNSPPSADASAGSPYSIYEGESLTLNAANSSDPDSDTLTYLWDLDNDLVYGDAVGENPTINWATLQSNNINDEGIYTIGLKVDDGHGGTDTTTTTITVNNIAPILSTTGFSSVALGDVYTLNLSVVDPGEDIITEWVINWGDGVIETFTGNPSVVTHTYTNGGFTNNILASATDEDGTYLQNDLLVTDYINAGGIFHYSETGEFLERVGTGDLDKPIGVIVGPDGNWYGTGEVSGNVYRYNTDGGTAKVIKGGFGEADGLAFDSEGNLLVASWAQNKVYKLTHNTSDDSYTQTEVVSDAPFNRPYGLVFDSSGDLYVSSYADHNVQRLVLNVDGSYTSSVFINNGLGGLDSPEQMAFGPDGKLYLTSAGSKEILRYNPENVDDPDPAKLVMEVIATLPSGGKPEGLAFGPDGNLYISDHDFGDIIRFNMIINGDGELEVQGGAETFIDGANSTPMLTKPVFMAFIPEQQVTVINTNQTPVIIDQIFTLPENSLDGTSVGTVMATDPDVGDNLSYTITAGNDFNAFTMSNTGVITIADSNQLDFETNPTFSLTVQVMDDGTGALSSTATVSINLNPVNEAPVITDQPFTLPENSLDGITVGTVTATDPDVGDNLSYTITAGNDLNAFAISNSGVLTVADSSQLDFETNSTFSLTVQVMDDGTGTLNNTATISINLSQVNEAPVITSQTFTLPENSLNGITVGTVSATDPDVGDNLSYTITAGNDLNAFAMSNAGVLTVADSSQLDFETNSTFSLTVQVMDDGTGTLSSTATVSIKLSSVNEAPVITDQPFTLPENSLDGITVGTVTATDPDVGDNLSYTITAGNDLNAFAISNAGVLTVADSSQLDFETNPIFNLTVQVSDGSLSHTATISINLTDINESPVINDQSFSLAENSADNSVVGTIIANDTEGDMLVYSITAGNDSNVFSINNSTGAITVNDSNQLDYETTPIFNLTVQVSDGNLSDTAAISINLTEINELSNSISLSNNRIDEHVDTSTGITIGLLISFDENAHSYQINGGADQDKFFIGGNANNELFLKDGVLDFEKQSSYQVTVSAIDSKGTGHNETFIVNVNNLNELPVITSSNSFTLEENISSIATVIAEDGDQPVQKLSFSLSGGADSALFLLDSDTGELSFKTAPDFENPGDSSAENIYIVEITVDDGNGGIYTQPVSIQIENAAEAPELSDQSVAIEEQSNVGSLVTTLVANDPDANETFSYSIVEGNLSDAFSIDNTGQLIVSNPELLINQDNSIVSVVIQVTDSQGLTDTSVVRIDIQSILPDTSTSKTESELEKQDEFAFSVLTEIPLEDVTTLTKNETASIPELNESETIEQAKTEDNTVIENTENIGIDTGQVEIGSLGMEAEIKQEKLSFSIQKNSKEDNSWTSKNILIKAKALMINNALSPQFSYFDIEANALKTLIQESGLSERLDELREQIQENTHFEKTIVGSSITLTTGLSIGYVIWLVRGGVLLSSVLSTLPAWRMIDPLPVISSLNGSLGDDDKNGDSLASLIKKGSAVVKAKVQASKPPSD